MEFSRIVRQYLEDRFAIRAPEMTTEEFLISLKTSSQLTAEQKQIVGQFLDACDQVKFARHLPTEKEVQHSFDLMKRFITQTR